MGVKDGKREVKREYRDEDKERGKRECVIDERMSLSWDIRI